MIGIPYALAEAGFGLGLLLLLLVAGLTDYSLRLMVRAAHLSGTTSYQVFSTHAVNQSGQWVEQLKFCYSELMNKQGVKCSVLNDQICQAPVAFLLCPF